MATKNVKNANYWQVNKDQPQICSLRGAEILPSRIAWERYSWFRKYFFKKPQYGYSIWINHQPNGIVYTCVNIDKKGIKQGMNNLLVIEKNLKVTLRGTCSALKKNLSASHQAQGKIILKESSVLNYEHFHSWGGKDFLDTDYDFILEKRAKLNYNYKILSSPRKAKIKTNVDLKEESSADTNIVGSFSDTQTEIKDNLILKGKNCSGMAKLRLVGNKNSRISACSQIKALAESKGHLDCQGLLIDKKAKISLTPELICENKKAQLTHEASIGKISEQELIYLRMRGFTEKQAIDLIVNGFLRK